MLLFILKVPGSLCESSIHNFSFRNSPSIHMVRISGIGKCAPLLADLERKIIDFLSQSLLGPLLEISLLVGVVLLPETAFIVWNLSV